MGWLRKDKVPFLVYTDGSCLKNPGGIGGWAAVIVYKGEAKELSGGAENSTNNRMELTAAIEALKTLPDGSDVFLFTDSQYLKRGISWMYGWKNKGWKTVGGGEVQNQDLWEQLLVENDRHVISWHWLKGHSGDVYNEWCDLLAIEAAKLVANGCVDSVK